MVHTVHKNAGFAGSVKNLIGVRGKMQDGFTQEKKRFPLAHNEWLVICYSRTYLKLLATSKRKDEDGHQTG